MAIQIFHTKSGTVDEGLQVNDNGSLTYSRFDPALKRQGTESKTEVLTAQQAKRRWPDHADKIDKALAEKSN